MSELVKYKYHVGQHLLDDKRDIVLTDKEFRVFNRISKGKSRIQRLKFYKYTCNKCGYCDGFLEENNLNKGYGCACCVGNVVAKGINDIGTTCKWMIPFIANKDDVYKYAKTSNKKIDFVCPDCGEVDSRMISNVYKRGFSCKKCGDGLSFGEKAMMSVLNQLQVSFVSQKKFEWSQNKIYDFFLNNGTIIIETHGKQHYKESDSWRGLEYEQKNDNLKKELAENNGVLKYIVIDCRESTLDYFKNSVINSELSSLFEISIIDWDLVHKDSLRKLVFSCAELWNSGIHSATEISEILKVSRTTVAKYLKKATELGICSYNAKNIASDSNTEAPEWLIAKNFKISEAHRRIKGKKVLCVSTGMVFETVSDCATYYNCKNSSISRVCRGERNHYRNLLFKYID